jgi:hypothetical protein
MESETGKTYYMYIIHACVYNTYKYCMYIYIYVYAHIYIQTDKWNSHFINWYKYIYLNTSI